MRVGVGCTARRSPGDRNALVAGHPLEDAEPLHRHPPAVRLLQQPRGVVGDLGPLAARVAARLVYHEQPYQPVRRPRVALHPPPRRARPPEHAPRAGLDLRAQVVAPDAALAPQRPTPRVPPPAPLARHRRRRRLGGRRVHDRVVVLHRRLGRRGPPARAVRRGRVPVPLGRRDAVAGRVAVVVVARARVVVNVEAQRRQRRRSLQAGQRVWRQPLRPLAHRPTPRHGGHGGRKWALDAG